MFCFFVLKYYWILTYFSKKTNSFTLTFNGKNLGSWLFRTNRENLTLLNVIYNTSKNNFSLTSLSKLEKVKGLLLNCSPVWFTCLIHFFFVDSSFYRRLFRLFACLAFISTGCIPWTRCREPTKVLHKFCDFRIFMASEPICCFSKLVVNVLKSGVIFLVLHSAGVFGIYCLSIISCHLGLMALLFAFQKGYLLQPRKKILEIVLKQPFVRQ